jgi:hypothetical protein
VRVIQIRLAVILLAFGCSGEVERNLPAPTPQPTPASPAISAPLPLLVDVSALAGKSQADVSKALGKSDECTTINPSGIGKVPQCTYQNGRVEIVFIDARADWITVNDVGLPFKKESIEAFGFKVVLAPGDTPRPDLMLYWTNYPGFININFAPGASGTIDFAHFKAVTK